MKQIVRITVASALCMGAMWSAGDALAQQAADAPQQQAHHTWLHLSEVVARPERCREPIAGSDGNSLITFTTADGRAHLHCLELSADTVGQSGVKRPTASATETKPLALLSAYVVRPDGTPHPVLGPRPQDIVILTTGDGRVIVTFSDFSADAENGSYAYPTRVGAPVQ